ARGGEHGALAQLAGIVDTVVARGVDLDDVERASAIARELDTARARAAGRVGGTLNAVQAPGEDARRGGLAASAGPAEQVGVVDAPRAQRRLERFGHLRLADELGERLRPVAAVEGGDHAPSVVAATVTRDAGAGCCEDEVAAPGDESVSPRIGAFPSIRSLPRWHQVWLVGKPDSEEHDMKHDRTTRNRRIKAILAGGLVL